MKIRLMITAVVCGVMMLAGTQVKAQSEQDKAFLKKATEINVAEVDLGKLALQKSSNAGVRSFATRMVRDHTALEKKLTPYAEKCDVTPATSMNSEDQALYDHLKGVTGTEFDKAYVNAMDKGHHQALAAYKNEVSTTQDAKLKPVMEHGESVIAEHTRLADALSRKLGMQPAGA